MSSLYFKIKLMAV